MDAEFADFYAVAGDQTSPADSVTSPQPSQQSTSPSTAGQTLTDHQPVSDQSASPVDQQPMSSLPKSNMVSLSDHSAIQQPSYTQSANQQPSSNQSANQQPFLNQAANQQPLFSQSTNHLPSYAQSANQEPYFSNSANQLKPPVYSFPNQFPPTVASQSAAGAADDDEKSTAAVAASQSATVDQSADQVSNLNPAAAAVNLPYPSPPTSSQHFQGDDYIKEIANNILF